MNKHIAATVGLLSALLLHHSATGQVPQLINYQGRLLSGTNLVNGNVTLWLRLYNTPSGGVHLYEDTGTVAVVDGLYSTAIGDGTSYGALADALTNAELYLEVIVNSTILAPRERLLAAPYALRAGSLNGLSATDLVGRSGSIMTGPLTNLQTVTAAGFVGGGAGLTGIGGGSLLGGTISNVQLAANAVTTTNIADGAIVAADINAATFSNTFWKLDGNAGTVTGTHFLGSTDNRPVEIRANSLRALLITPSNGAPNIVLGSAANAIAGETYGVSILGGSNNAVSSGAAYSFIGGGSQHRIGTDSYGAAIAGGWNNTVASGDWGIFIGGGNYNMISNLANNSVICGGHNNRVGSNSQFAVIAGGIGNRINGNAPASFIGGGGCFMDMSLGWPIDSYAPNTIEEFAYCAVVDGGFGNAIGYASGFGTIGGGCSNQIGSMSGYSVIPGGRDNDVGAGAAYAFAAGRRAKANHAGAFVWADASDADFASTAANQFLIRAGGGVGIGTNATPEKLTVAGNVKATGFIGSGAGLTNIGGGSLAAGTISNLHLAANAVGSSQIAAGAVSNTELSINAVTGDKIANGTVSNADLAVGTITADRMVADTFVLVAGDIMTGALTNQQSVTADRFFNSNNTAAGADAVALGGLSNTIDGTASYAAIGGGHHNAIDYNGDYSFIGAGIGNEIATGAPYCVIGGGYSNQAGMAGVCVTIGGGDRNLVLTNADYSTIGGGQFNSIGENTKQGFIAGGQTNRIGASSSYASIGGGYLNSIGDAAPYATVAGGRGNVVGDCSTNAVVAGGYDNSISSNAPYNVAGGGRGNFIDYGSRDNVVGGGHDNLLEWNCRNNVIAGGSNNVIRDTGDGNFIGGGLSNSISRAGYGNVIGGGGIGMGGYDHYLWPNAIGEYSHSCVIAGGASNFVNGTYSVIAGGADNSIESSWSMIPGGFHCEISGYSPGALAAGYRAKIAGHPGAFVWADSSSYDFAATADDQFSVRALGGTRFVSGINGTGAITSGVQLVAGGGSWTSLSDVHAKENFRAVDGAGLLEKVAALPVQEWNYKTQDAAIRHLGPTAQDFKAAFGLGESDTGITSVDADGVALAAIQALAKQNAELKAKLDAVISRLDAMTK